MGQARVHAAGRGRGQRSSPAKRAAARKNGARGGRPTKAEALVRRMRAMHEKIGIACSHIDPHDLDLIIERMCRDPGSDRRFFIYPRSDGGYEI